MTKNGFVLFLLFFLLSTILGSEVAFAQQSPGTGFSLPQFNFGVTQAKSPQEVVGILRLLVILTVLSLAPAILIMMTSFTRIVIVLSFLRQAIGTVQMPPNQLIIGFALFLSFFIMGPTLKEIHANALSPYLDGKITQEVAMDRANAPIRKFMFKQTRDKDLDLFVTMTKSPRPINRSDVSTWVLIPAFVVSELKTAFQIGFMLYLPFLVIDMVIASLLMAMGMLMLPPAVVSLPFKLLLFVLVDGWQLVVGSLVKSFG